jgi:hypothetical protein
VLVELNDADRSSRGSSRHDSAGAVRYINLGQGGRWADYCLAKGEVHLGHAAVPHELALSGDRDSIRAFLVRTGKSPAKASDFAREISDFYSLGPDCLWVTEAHHYLWWTYADPEVTWIGGDGSTGYGFAASSAPGATPTGSDDLCGSMI